MKRKRATQKRKILLAPGSLTPNKLNTYIRHAWLQLSTSGPTSEYRVIFSGLSAVILEKVDTVGCPMLKCSIVFLTGVCASNHHGLLVSPHYHLFRDDNSPTPDEFPFIDD